MIFPDKQATEQILDILRALPVEARVATLHAAEANVSLNGSRIAGELAYEPGRSLEDCYREVPEGAAKR